MQGSQDKLRQVLEGKLFDHEATVSRDSRQAVLTRIRAARRGTIIRKALYSTAVIVMMSSVTYFVQTGNSVSPKSLAGAVSQPVEKNLPQATRASVTASQQIASPSANSGISSTSHKFSKTPLSAVSDKSTPAFAGASSHVVEREVQANGPGMQSVMKTGNEDQLLVTVAAPQAKSPGETVTPPVEETEIAQLNEIEITNPAEEPKVNKKIKLSIGLMPTLNYKRIVPNSSDNAYIYDFQTPSSFDASRFGVITTALAHFEMRKGRTLYAGAGFFNYKSKFSYSSSELGSNLTSSNEVNETLQGLSIVVGGTLPLKITEKRYINLNLGGQLQMPKASMQFVLQAGIEYGIRMNERNILFIQPVFFHSITSLHYNGLIAYPYGGGVDFRYQFDIGRD